MFNSRGAGWEETLVSGSVVEMDGIAKQPSTITPKEPDSKKGDIDNLTLSPVSHSMLYW